MPSDRRPARIPLPPSSPGTSAPPSEQESVQLSAPRGVKPKVSTAAMDRGLLMATTVPVSTSLPSALAGAEVTSDAEVMLRVKAGDQPAFNYLVEKYRRPLVSFMYRMARNAAVAEDLAQEVFLRVYRSRASNEASEKFTPWLYRIAKIRAVNPPRNTRNERREVRVSW